MGLNAIRGAYDKVKGKLSKNRNIEPWHVNVSRGTYQLPEKNPLVFKLDTPGGKATVILGKYRRTVVADSIYVKELLDTEITNRIGHSILASNTSKRYVSVPWVKSMTKGYYTKKGMGTLSVKRRIMDTVTFVTDKGFAEVPVTTMPNSNYVVIGEHNGLRLTDWTNFAIVPVNTYTGSINLVFPPSSRKLLGDIRDLDWALIEFSKPIIISGKKPPIKSREVGTTKNMRLSKGIMKMPCGSHNLYMYTHSNNIFINLNGTEYWAEAVPSSITGLVTNRLYTINTDELTACFITGKGAKNAEVILDASVRVKDEKKTGWRAKLQKFNDALIDKKLYCSDDVFIKCSIGVKTEDMTLTGLTKLMLGKYKI